MAEASAPDWVTPDRATTRTPSAWSPRNDASLMMFTGGESMMIESNRSLTVVNRASKLLSRRPDGFAGSAPVVRKWSSAFSEPTLTVRIASLGGAARASTSESPGARGASNAACTTPATEVRVDQQCPGTAERVRDGEVGCAGRLPILRQGTGHHDHLDRRPRVGEGDIGLQQPVGLRLPLGPSP